MENGLSPSRVDFVVSYEDVFDDEARQDRFLANLTYTLRLGDGVSIPIQLLYASKPEFLAAEDPDAQFTARLGLKLSLPGDKPGKKGSK